MRNLIGSILVAGTALVGPPAGASNGVLEINQACAAGPGCFPGDTANFPVQITAPGSYRLTGNLAVPDENTTAILVTASGVALDLGGFEIRGVTTCGGTPFVCTPATGSGRGVDAAGDHVSVRNGQVTGMGDSGLFLGARCTVENVRVASNRLKGVAGGIGCMIKRSNAAFNGEIGIIADTDSTIVDNVAQSNGAGIGCEFNFGCTFRGNSVHGNRYYGIFSWNYPSVIGNSVYQNGGDGISTGVGATIIGNTVFSNGDATNPTIDDGIECSSGCLVQSNTVRSNKGVGLRLGSDSTYQENVVTANVTNGVVGGTNLGSNHCAGTGVVAPTCP